MRFSFLKTVAARIIILMLCYAVMVTSLIIAFSSYIIYTNQHRINVQSAEFNLRLASQNIDRDLLEIIALAGWCSRSNPPARFLTRSYDPIQAVNSFVRLQEEFRNNRSTRYIKRILVISHDGSKVLHLSDYGSSPLVLPGNNNELHLQQYELDSSAKIYDISPDPYSQNKEKVLTVLAPVYSTASTSATAVTGTVYIAVYTSIITDSLKGYAPTEYPDFVLTIGTQSYVIDGGELFPLEARPEGADTGSELSAGELTVGSATDWKGSKIETVSSKIREGMYLTQTLRSDRSMLAASSWTPMIVAICALIMALSAIIILMMNRAISQPVVRIRKKTEAIANGDFSPDPSIESDSEIGEVGRSINQLSRDVVGLMEKRLADEQSKQELEYRMLQGQINPHFLYNTLGSIKWMATLQKANGIAEMTTALSNLLRTTAKDLRKVVPLRDEISLLDDYYIILKYRYGGTIQYDKHIESEALLECALPRFVLQPLMENAIFHGIEPKGKGRLELCVQRRDEAVCISMTDDGIGLSQADLHRIGDLSQPDEPSVNGMSSVGLRNVHQRIQNVFGPAYGLTVESEENVYTKVTICVPYSPD